MGHLLHYASSLSYITYSFHFLSQIANCPPGTQGVCPDISKAYQNSPILPKHKPYILVKWNGDIYVKHCAVFGLAPSGGIQGTVADVLINVFNFHGIKDAMKWVDDFIFFCSPTGSHLSSQFIYNYDLDTVLSISSPLGVPWHPYWVKGSDFAILVTFVSHL